MIWGALAYSSLMAIIDIISLGLVKASYLGSLPLFTGLFLSTLIYATQPFLFYNSMRFEGMAVINLLWNVLSSIVVTLLGILYFEEKLNNKKLIGALFSIVAIILLASD